MSHITSSVSTRTGTAKRVNEATARHHFNAGGRVAISVDGELTFDVYPSTTTIHRDHWTWPALLDVMHSYGDHRQAFYVIHPTWANPECIMAGRVARDYTLPLRCTSDTVDLVSGVRACGLHGEFFVDDCFAVHDDPTSRPIFSTTSTPVGGN